MLMSYFCICKLWVFAVEDRHLKQVFASQQGLWSHKFVKMFLDNGQTTEYW